jgi:predicted metal-binding protein
MKKVGILNCSNMSQNLGCSMFGCLAAIRRGVDEFVRYGDEGAELLGVINCAGCPTVMAPQKILGRVRALASLGVNAIHFSGCMTGMCPFKDRYASLIDQHFPSVEVVMGTHAFPEGDTGEKLTSAVLAEISGVGRKNAVDIAIECDALAAEMGET